MDRRIPFPRKAHRWASRDRLRSALVALFFPLSLVLHAQCGVDQTLSSNTFDGWRGAGQTFVAPCSGPLVEVVKPQGPAPDRIEVRSSSPTGPLLYSQVNPVMVAGVHALTTPVSLVAGTTYAVLFYRADFNNGDQWYDQNVVPGNLFAYSGTTWSSFTAFELQFSVRVLPLISTGGPVVTSFCAGTGFALPFTVDGQASVGNIFTAQLSDAAGSFDSPVAIGSLPGTSGGTIACTIPVATPGGSGYRVRVVSSSPVVHGSVNGTDLTIVASTTWYEDADGDGFGNPDFPQNACLQPTGYVANNTDCDDSNAAINPNAVEVCDGTDNNCNGLVDDADPAITGQSTWYADQDSDGFGDPATTMQACAQPGGYVANNTDNCPLLFGLIGDYCDADADPNLVQLGIISNSCVCQPIGGDEEVFLELRTPNGSSAQISWEIEQVNGNLVICSGSGYPANITSPIVPTCGLVKDECYRLRVFDIGGDGFGVGGGYQLRLPGSYPQGTPLASNMLRIIDNSGNFNSGTLSTLGNGPNAFCLPMSTQAPIFASRDKLDWVTGQYIVAEADPDVSAEWQVGDQTDDGYEFWFFDPNGSYNFRRFRNHATSDGFANVGATRACHARINGWLASNHIPTGVLMNVRIRARVNGVDKPWGPAFRFMIDPVRAQCPLTKLIDDPNNPLLSCNQTRNWGNGNYIHARPVSGANRYQFRFRIADEGFNRVMTSNSYILQLNWATQPLQPGKTYDVDVRISRDGGNTWCIVGNSWGESCKLTIAGGNAQGGGGNLAEEPVSSQASFTLWPNPNNGELLTLSLNGIAESVQSVAVDIFDLSGKRVVNREVAVTDGPGSSQARSSTPLGEGRNGGSLYTVLELNGELATGVYLVSLTAGSERYTQRLVVGR